MKSIKNSLNFTVLTLATLLMLTGCSNDNNQTLNNNYKHEDNFEKVDVVNENTTTDSEEIEEYKDKLEEEHDKVTEGTLIDKVQTQSEIEQIEIEELGELDNNEYNKEYTGITAEPNYDLFNETLLEYGATDSWTFGTALDVLETVCSELNIRCDSVVPGSEYPEEVQGYTVWKFTDNIRNIEVAVSAELDSAKVSIK